MAGRIERDSTDNPAAASIVAGLVHREFGKQNTALPELSPALAAEVIQIAKGNKILKPVLKQFEALSIAVPEDVELEVSIYFRKSMKNNAAALATMCEVSKALTRAGIVHAAFKGPARQI